MSLMDVFQFDQTDLVTNRDGQLSERQRAMLAPYGRSTKGGAFAILFPIVLLMGVIALGYWLYGSVLSSDQLATFQPYLLPAAAGMLLFVILIALASRRQRNKAAAQIADAVQGGQVQSVSGRAKASYGREYEASGDDLRDAYSLIIGDLSLEPLWSIGWHPDMPQVFAPEANYTAYYLTLRHPAGFPTRIVLSIEQIN